MVVFILGMLGGFMIVSSCIAGLLIGRYVITPDIQKVEKPDEKLIKEIKEQEEAFQQLLQYNINDVYGTGVSDNGGEF